MCQGVNLKSGCQQSSGCSWRQALIACQGVNIMSGGNSSSGRITQVRVFYFVRVFLSSQGINLCQGELLKSGGWQPSKAYQGEVFHQGVKSKSGGFCTNFTAGQEAKKVVTGNATFMEKQCGPYKIKVHKCLAKNGKNQQRYLSTPSGPYNKPKVWQGHHQGVNTLAFHFSLIYFVSL